MDTGYKFTARRQYGVIIVEAELFDFRPESGIRLEWPVTTVAPPHGEKLCMATDTFGMGDPKKASLQFFDMDQKVEVIVLHYQGETIRLEPNGKPAVKFPEAGGRTTPPRIPD